MLLEVTFVISVLSKEQIQEAILSSSFTLRTNQDYEKLAELITVSKPLLSL